MIIETVKRLLGRAVRDARERAGITQQALADSIGRSLGAVGGLERGDVWPEYETLSAIATALRVPEASLFTWAPAPTPTPQEALAVLDRVINAPVSAESADPLAARVAALKGRKRAQLEAALSAIEESPISPDSDEKLGQKHKQSLDKK